MYLVSVWEGRTGNHLARGQDIRTERSELRTYWPRAEIFPRPARPNSVNKHFIIFNIKFKILKILFRDYITSDGRARNSYKKDSIIKTCHLFLRVEQESHNSSQNTTRFSFFFSHFISPQLQFLLKKKKQRESWHKAVKIMSNPLKNLASEKSSLHTSLKLFILFVWTWSEDSKKKCRRRQF